MAAFKLLVQGAEVVGGAQKLSVVASTVEEVITQVASQVRLVAGFLPEHITDITYYDDGFQEFVLLSNIVDLPQTCKIGLVVDDSRMSPMARRAFEAQLEQQQRALTPSRPASALVDVSAMLDAPAGSSLGVTQPFVKGASLPVGRGPNKDEDDDTFPITCLTTQLPIYGAEREVWQALTKTFVEALSCDANVLARFRQAQLKLIAGGPCTEDEAAEEGRRVANLICETYQLKAEEEMYVGLDPSINVMCTYFGTDQNRIHAHWHPMRYQRAKAVKVNRMNPDFDGLLATLQQKFATRLKLGYIASNGTVCDIEDAEGLRGVIDLCAPEDISCTILCWEVAHGADPIEEYRLSPTHFRMPEPPVLDKNGKRKRQKQKPTVSKSRFADMEGIPTTKADLEELFRLLDDSGDGTLSRQEFSDLLDELPAASMGDANIAKKRFQNMLDKCEAAADNRITFDEFCVIMLKIAQW
jgi:hypothetical protein